MAVGLFHCWPHLYTMDCRFLLRNCKRFHGCKSCEHGCFWRKEFLFCFPSFDYGVLELIGGDCHCFAYGG